MAVGIGLASERHRATLDDGALGHRDHRIVARVRLAICDQVGGQPVDVDRHFGDDGAVDAREVCRDQ